VRPSDWPSAKASTTLRKLHGADPKNCQVDAKSDSVGPLPRFQKF
jgi:hypothetical protein